MGQRKFRKRIVSAECTGQVSNVPCFLILNVSQAENTPKYFFEKEKNLKNNEKQKQKNPDRGSL